MVNDFGCRGACPALCATVQLTLSIHTGNALLPAELTLSGFSRSAIAVPSAKNSGLLRISKCTAGSEQFRLNTCSAKNVI